MGSSGDTSELSSQGKENWGIIDTSTLPVLPGTCCSGDADGVVLAARAIFQQRESVKTPGWAEAGEMRRKGVRLVLGKGQKSWRGAG